MTMKLWKLVSAATALILSTTSYASTIYTYTGNSFNEFSSPSSYDGSMSITATIELDSALGFSLDEQYFTPASFSINDGVNTITDQNATYTQISFSTDSSGGITGWRVYTSIGLDTFDTIGEQAPFMFTQYNNQSYFDRDAGNIYTCTDSVISCAIDAENDYGRIDFAQGEWVVTEVSAVPIPAAVWLFGSGLIGLAGFARRKKA